MAPHSSTLAWKIPWTEEPGRLQSMGSLRVEMRLVSIHSFYFVKLGRLHLHYIFIDYLYTVKNIEVEELRNLIYC